ncbi:hypothetical protein KFE25_003763 [Diacronema lutheri]|mgnify:CR=1 FL=1|uniref:Cysteine-rich PDZ-binding protein n=2 Tax=Diacronema lutheri TaxID=2081491 RepID=A0A8J5X6E3_DIALT|nr:hypothetical protein KFE25_003763 [Diacronema lutheri]
MVCGDCESKLSRVGAPDPWKSGSRNNNEPGGRRIGENKALGKSYAAHRHNPYARSACTVCKQPVSHASGLFCQPCAYSKGVCAMCGKQVLDTRFYAMGDGSFGKGRKHDPKTFHPDGWAPESAPAADEPPAAKPKKRPKPATPATPAPAAPAARAAETSGADPAGWQHDASTGLFFCVQAQAYYDAHSAMYFAGGQWSKELPQQPAACAQHGAAACAQPGAATCAQPGAGSGEGAPGHPLRASACASAPAAAAMAGSHGASAAREARSVGAPASAESA